MNKILKYSIIGIVVLSVLLFLSIILYPVLFHFDCYSGGGKWRGLPTTGVDYCWTKGAGGEAITAGCDCGNDKCWDGNRCVPNEEKYCEIDEDCITSCGSPSGFLDTGSNCYNKEYVIQSWNESGLLIGSGNSPIDGACCLCDTATYPYHCTCQNNICTSKKD